MTCTINGNRINCRNDDYTKIQLKEWSSKDILRCPVCNGAYEYCHGRIITPYFRHKEKTMCSELYTEPETEEHKSGKIALYEWVLAQPDLMDVVLEGWIPGTKQRPDIMFKYKGVQYVIEYQCTPICTEYYERHELYKAGGIIDIWITGTEKYNFQSIARRGFTIEQFAIASFDAYSKKLNFSESHMKKVFPETECYSHYLPKKHLVGHCCFLSGTISVMPDYICDALSEAVSKFKQEEEVYSKLVKTKEMILTTLEEINEKYNFVIEVRSSPNYTAKIKFKSGYVAFVKEDRIDYCIIEFGKLPQFRFSRKKRRTVITGYRDRFYHKKVATDKFNQISRNDIISSIERFCTQNNGGV